MVAGEIRKLAEESAKSAKVIVDLLSNNREQTQIAVGIIDKLVEAVEQSRTLSHRSREALDEIMRRSQSIDEQAKQISQALERQAQALEEMNKTINEISGAAQDISSGMEEINASTEQQLKAAKRLTELTERLAGVERLLTERVGLLNN